MILDTDFFTSLRAGEESAIRMAAGLEGSGQPTRVPTAVLQELYVGVGAGSSDAAQEYDALLANEPLVHLDENIARKAGHLEGEHIASDSKPELGPVDAIVAATGLTHSEPVVSRDEDFQSVDGLIVESW